MEVSTFLSTYPNATQWSSTHKVYVKVINETQPTTGMNNLHPLKTVMMDKSHVFNPNLQKKLIFEYDQKSKLKSQEWSKLKSDEKSVMTIIFR